MRRPRSRGVWKAVVKDQQLEATQMAEIRGCSGTRLRETMPTVSREILTRLGVATGPGVVGSKHTGRMAAPAQCDDEDEEMTVDILPDVVQGWLLLESIIQCDIKSHFSLQGVSLRAHWTDSQVRRRDGADDRHQANFEDLDWDEQDETLEWDQGYFENWDPSDIALFQEDEAVEQEAWAQKGGGPSERPGEAEGSAFGRR